ncbi:MAG: hypothetical protein KC731_00845 [Myxococcales bacterium]|nr:hypothetical protein [Myxococcales bacterium]
MGEDSYAAILDDAERARWSLAEATARLADLDFELPFLPEALVHGERLPFLTARERVVLSQIRGHAYLRIFALAKKFILPFVMTQAANCLYGDSEELLALMGFGQEEAKHATLFDRFSTAFGRGFDTVCEVVGPAEDIAAKVLLNHKLAVGLAVAHFELMSQSHYVRAARSDATIDQGFQELLRLHWREECQHVRLDALILKRLAAQCSPYERERAVQQYLDLLDDLAGVLRDQVDLDLEAFERSARPLTDGERETWRHEQARSYDDVYIRQGLDHAVFRSTIAAHFGGPFAALDEAARRFASSAASVFPSR